MVGPGSAHVAALSPLLVLALLAVVYALVWRARRALRERPEAVVLAALTALLAVLVGNKVLSPQHLLWVLPLTALCLVARPLLTQGRRGACAGGGPADPKWNSRPTTSR